MANININTTNRQDKAIKILTDKYNLDTNNSLTPVQYFTNELKVLLERLVNRAENLTNLSLTEVYSKASPEDQAIIDALKEKYK